REQRSAAQSSTEEAEAATPLTTVELREFLREILPEHMIPSAFMTLERLPLTPNGKVDRAALPEPEFEAAAGYVAPRTPTEELLAGIWAEVLGLSRVSVEDNFFELGGHSLLATRLVSRVRELFKVELPLRALFEQPTVEGLARAVEALLRDAGAEEPLPPVEPVPHDGPLPLSFAQQRLWFIDQLEGGSAFYNSPAAVRLRGPLDAAALARALSEVARRHGVLRTRFGSEGGEPYQLIEAAAPVELGVTDLSGMEEAAREAEAARLAAEEARRPFDLSRGPLLRASLLRLSEGEHVLLLTMHHIASDAWSLGVLVREAGALYEAFSSGKPSPLAELPVQYADYAVWQRRHLSGERLEAQLAYWRRQLAGLPPTLELPGARVRPAAQAYRGQRVTFRLDAEVAGGLRRVAREQGATLFMVLLAGFAALLARLAGRHDVAVGTPVAGRGRAELEGLIGFFINTLVLRVDLSGDPAFSELVERVREVCLGAYAHEEVPFERVVEELAPERTLARSPLFQVAFGVQNVPIDEPALAGLELSPLVYENESGRYDLTLWMFERGDGLGGRLTFDADIYEEGPMRLLCERYARLLRSAAEAPGERCARLEIFTEEEKSESAAKRRSREETNLKKLRSIRKGAAQAPQGADAAPVYARDERDAVLKTGASD
ncbi:MAG TPA: condensation domain-containing protein, partial [Pyrinomonadaceae bacterium]|nr:condensation domain-containing protein [Pyrinomonadaceae bacterium]